MCLSEVNWVPKLILALISVIYKEGVASITQILGTNIANIVSCVMESICILSLCL